MHHFLAYSVTLCTFLVVDATWLFFVAGGFFKSQVGPLLREQPNLVAAAIFYLIYAAGLTVLVVQPALQARSAMVAAIKGAVLGLTAYATFDLTNLAIIKGWTLAVAVADMGWGTFATALACVAGYYAGQRAMER